jgi:hypothetical protein
MGAQLGGAQRVAAELLVVQRSFGGPGEPVADVGPREGVLVGREERGDLHPGAVLVPVRAVEGAAARGGALARVGGDPQVVVGRGRARDPCVAHRDAHALQRLVAVQRVAGGAQGAVLDAVAARLGGVGVGDAVRVQPEGGGQLRAAPFARGTVRRGLPGGAGELGDGLAAGLLAARVELADLAGDRQPVPDGDSGALLAGVDEDPLARGRVVVGVGVLEPEAAR